MAPTAPDEVVRPDAEAEPVSEQSQPDETAEVAYSVFTTTQKKVLVLSASLGAIFSPMSTTIYLPALNQIASDLKVDSTKINLTVTTFLVCHLLMIVVRFLICLQIMQGIAPMMVAGFSDTAGRRPTYNFCFTVYIAANIGLALQRNYAALLVLRCLQSAGASGTVALANGVVADLVTSAERGTYIAYTSVTSVLGPIIGPVTGGLIAQYRGWQVFLCF